MEPHDEITRRARLHAALGDTHRLAIVDALQLSDLRSSELSARLGLPSNRLAHHLGVLREAGLIRALPSSGDGRGRYWTSQAEALGALTRGPQLRAGSVLFVCTQNAARSQMAAALWARHSPVPAASAGVQPAARVHPLAVETARRHGLDLGGARPRRLSNIDFEPDLVVTVCDQAHEALRATPAPALHWSVPDPVPAGRRAAFEQAFQALRVRVEQLAGVLQAS